MFLGATGQRKILNLKFIHECENQTKLNLIWNFD